MFRMGFGIIGEMTGYGLIIVEAEGKGQVQSTKVHSLERKKKIASKVREGTRNERERGREK